MSELLFGGEILFCIVLIMNCFVVVLLGQWLLVLLLVLLFGGVGLYLFWWLLVDVYFDFLLFGVELVIQWFGYVVEEVECLIIVLVECGMIGILCVMVMCLILLYGLLVVNIIFVDGIDNYVVCQVVFNCLGDLGLFDGVVLLVLLLFLLFGLIYCYVLQSLDCLLIELKMIEDWIVELVFCVVLGVVDDLGFGGGMLQYQVQLDLIWLVVFGFNVS